MTGTVLGSWNDGPITRVPLPVKTPSNAAVNLVSRSRTRDLNLLAPSPRSMRRVAGLLGGPGSGRMGGDAHDVHGPGLEIPDVILHDLTRRMGLALPPLSRH